jgi:hypothetical protein
MYTHILGSSICSNFRIKTWYNISLSSKFINCNVNDFSSYEYSKVRSSNIWIPIVQCLQDSSYFSGGIHTTKYQSTYYYTSYDLNISNIRSCVAIQVKNKRNNPGLHRLGCGNAAPVFLVRSPNTSRKLAQIKHKEDIESNSESTWVARPGRPMCAIGTCLPNLNTNKLDIFSNNIL